MALQQCDIDTFVHTVLKPVASTAVVPPPVPAGTTPKRPAIQSTTTTTRTTTKQTPRTTGSMTSSGAAGSRKNIPETKTEISPREGNKYFLNVQYILYAIQLCVMYCNCWVFLSPVGSNDVYVAVTSPSQHSLALYVILPIGLYQTYILYI